MSALDWVGSLAAVLTTLSFLPQVLQVWRTRCAKDISLGMYAIFTGGVALWMIYGFMLGSLPIIVANGVTCVLAGAVLAMKLKANSRSIRAETRGNTPKGSPCGMGRHLSFCSRFPLSPKGS